MEIILQLINVLGNMLYALRLQNITCQIYLVNKILKNFLEVSADGNVKMEHPIGIGLGVSYEVKYSPTLCPAI